MTDKMESLPLKDIHLWYDPGSGSLRASLVAFGVIGLLILLLEVKM